MTSFNSTSGRIQHKMLDGTQWHFYKAIIHNAAKTSLEAQNRNNRLDFRAYLLVRAAHVAQLNPKRGRRLAEAIKGL